LSTIWLPCHSSLWWGCCLPLIYGFWWPIWHHQTCFEYTNSLSSCIPYIVLELLIHDGQFTIAGFSIVKWGHWEICKNNFGRNFFQQTRNIYSQH
jgi:hypothetical protein